jgi:hypothetical protein
LDATFDDFRFAPNGSDYTAQVTLRGHDVAIPLEDAQSFGSDHATGGIDTMK